MRIGNIAGRAVLIGHDNALDIERASRNRFGPSPQAVWDAWSEVEVWGQEVDVDAHADAVPLDENRLESPSPSPSQVFGIGLNYADHAAEAGLPLPEQPLVFTKFPSSISGPFTEVTLSSDRVDWEAELVVVVGTGGRHILESEAWSAVAGLAVGQDLSDRTVQQWGAPSAQFSLGKSFEGYSPVGPWVTTVDEVGRSAILDALVITCSIQDQDESAEIVQNGNTSNLIFSVPVLIARLSQIVKLRPGDLIFSGTPAGVGIGRTPQRFLRAGQRLTSSIEGVGEITQLLAV